MQELVLLAHTTSDWHWTSLSGPQYGYDRCADDWRHPESLYSVFRVQTSMLHNCHEWYNDDSVVDAGPSSGL
jgi:hypothetical protein